MDATFQSKEMILSEFISRVLLFFVVVHEQNFQEPLETETE